MTGTSHSINAKALPMIATEALGLDRRKARMPIGSYLDIKTAKTERVCICLGRNAIPVENTMKLIARYMPAGPIAQTNHYCLGGRDGGKGK